jgi:non-ribosomal peptide synthetase component F
MQNVSMPTIELPGLSLAPVQSEITTSKFDLAVFMQEGPAGLQGSVVYSIDLFDEQTIISMLRRFEVLLQSIVTNPDTPVDVLEISTDDEKHGKELEKKTRREKEINRLKGSKSKGIHIDLS